MPISKTTKAERIARGECSLCSCPAAVKSDGTRAKHCTRHLEYYRNLRRAYANENGEGRHNRCSHCRKLGHNAPHCPELKKAAN